MMEAARTSEMSVDNYFTWQYIREDNSELHTRRHENVKSHNNEDVECDFSAAMPCSLVACCQHFGEMYGLQFHLQDYTASQPRLSNKDEVTSYNATWCHNPEDN
jgi:hypothetical protein